MPTFSFLEVIKIINQIEKLLQIEVFLVGGAVRDLLLENFIKDLDLTTKSTPQEIEQAVRKAGRKPFLIGQKFGTVGFKLEISTEQSATIFGPRPNLKINSTDLSQLELEKNQHQQENQTKPNSSINSNLEFQNLNSTSCFIYVEITTFRGEIYEPHNRKPQVNFVSSLQEDLARRDLTINAIALDKLGQIYDPFGGVLDLDRKLIRAVGSPKTRFREDPLRLLRAVRLAAKLGFEIENQTWLKIQSLKWEILHVSKERWVLELDQILASPRAAQGLNLLMDSGVLLVMIPELTLQKNYNQNSPYHDFDLWTHTLKVVQNVPSDQLNLRWTALLHDIAKPLVRTENKRGYSNYLGHEILGAQMAQKVCHYLKFSRERTDFIVHNIVTHLQPSSLLKPFDDAGKKIKPGNIETFEF